MPYVRRARHLPKQRWTGELVPLPKRSPILQAHLGRAYKVSPITLIEGLIWVCRGKWRSAPMKEELPKRNAASPTFKDENRALQELARELTLLRAHNLQFKEGDPQDKILMFAEAALVCLTLEHFVRVVLGDDAAEREPWRSTSMRLGFSSSHSSLG